MDLNDGSMPVPDVAPVSRRTRLSLALASMLPPAAGTAQGTAEGPSTWAAMTRRVRFADEHEWDDEYDASTVDERDDSNYVLFDEDDGDGFGADVTGDEDDTQQHEGESHEAYEDRLNGMIPLTGAFLLPARLLLNGSELKEGTWHPAADELSAHVLADLEFHRSQWFVPVGRTFHCFQDWTVAMGYHGAVQLTDRHLEHKQAVAACNQRSSNMQRRCSRMLVKYGLTTAVGGKTPAADLYSGRLTGAAGVTAGVQTPVTLVVGAEKATLTRRTLSGSTPVGDSHVGCGCHPHPAAHISHTADATPPPGHAATFPPPAGSPRRFSNARGRARVCASSSFGFHTRTSHPKPRTSNAHA